MKKAFLLVVLVYTSYSQAQSQFKKTYTKDVQNFVAVSPSKAKKINGLNFKMWDEEENSQQINGVEFGLNPLMIFAPILSLMYSSEILEMDLENFYKHKEDIFKTVNGLQISIGSIEPTKTNGIAINISGNLNAISNGLAISPTTNRHYEISGLSISVIGNSDYKVRGIQIGLFNKSKDLRGLQIGLWNKNGKRSLPILNWQFKS